MPSPFITAFVTWLTTVASQAGVAAVASGQTMLNGADDQLNAAYLDSISLTGRQNGFDEALSVVEYSPAVTLLQDDPPAYADYLRSWLLWTMARTLVEGVARSTSPLMLRSHVDALVEINLQRDKLAEQHDLQVDVVIELPELSFDTYHRFERNLKPLLPRSLDTDPTTPAPVPDMLRLYDTSLHAPERAGEYLLRCRVFQLWWRMATSGNTSEFPDTTPSEHDIPQLVYLHGVFRTFAADGQPVMVEPRQSSSIGLAQSEWLRQFVDLSRDMLYANVNWCDSLDWREAAKVWRENCERLAKALTSYELASETDRLQAVQRLVLFIRAIEHDSGDPDAVLDGDENGEPMTRDAVLIKVQACLVNQTLTTTNPAHNPAACDLLYQAFVGLRFYANEREPVVLGTLARLIADHGIEPMLRSRSPRAADAAVQAIGAFDAAGADLPVSLVDALAQLDDTSLLLNAATVEAQERPQ